MYLESGRVVTGEGVLFQSKELAQKYADAYDKDLVEVDGGWLAKNRVTEHGPMPTKEGDVVIFHFHQLYRMWVAPLDGAQGPDPDIDPLDFWEREEGQRGRDQLGEGKRGGNLPAGKRW